NDAVDDDWISKPRKWDMKFIKRFMLMLGILSSVFDYLTFGLLLLLVKAGETEFQTGWFIESVVSASLIVLVVRTHKSFIKNKPGKYLLGSTLLIAIISLLFTLLRFAHVLGFSNWPVKFYIAMLAVVMTYIVLAEIIKRSFYKSFHNQ
ncbi:MAG: cation transporting ATPase C-terminal domain-containing protein, partial [Ginsengibacter sp.]